MFRKSSKPSVNDFEVISQIGVGSFGTCEKIRRKSDKKILVWKKMTHVDPKAVHEYNPKHRTLEELTKEVELLKTLHSPFIVAYYGKIVDTPNKTLYIIMEHCGGGDLARLIESRTKHKKLGALPEETVWIIFVQLVLALKECHTPRKERGTRTVILHRDIKPQNIFVCDHLNYQVKLGDFGVSRTLREERMAQTFTGTMQYMSPELIKNSWYNEKCDIWSLGCVVYELIALHPTFEAFTQRECSRNILVGRYPSLSKKYSPALRNLVYRMLQIEADKRPTALELAQGNSVSSAIERLKLANKDKGCVIQ